MAKKSEVKYQVFVSSTFEDLKDERKEVSQGILETHCIPAGMELFPAASKKQWDFIKHVIDESDIYLVIVAGRYGSVGTDDDGNRISYTEMEFDYAQKTGKPIIALVHQNPDSLPKSKCEKTLKQSKNLERFRRKVSSGRLIKSWDNKDNLKSAVIQALYSIINDDDLTLKGWIKADTASSLKMSVQAAALTTEDDYLRLKLQMREAENSSLKAEVKRLSEGIITGESDEAKTALAASYYLPRMLESNTVAKILQIGTVLPERGDFKMGDDVFRLIMKTNSSEGEERYSEILMWKIYDTALKQGVDNNKINQKLLRKIFIGPIDSK
ncbi:MAG: DUF4062 domain-containing protein [Lachnospiraceae bacterium]|nr:DUF4062 domain-containing protein [Lachnospiraceae bacterium]